MLKNVIKSSICVFLLLGVNTAYAKENKVSTELVKNGETSKGLAAAYELLESMNMEDTYQKTLDRMIAAQSGIFPPELREKKEIMQKLNKIMTDFINKYVGWNKIREDMAKIYTKHYTASELQEIQNFYMTPTGQKSIKLMPEIAAESMKVTQDKMMPHMSEMQESIQRLMKEEIKLMKEEIKQKEK